MKLEIAEFSVTQIRLGHRLSYEGQVLEVDETALIDLVLQDDWSLRTDQNISLSWCGAGIGAGRFIVIVRSEVIMGGTDIWGQGKWQCVEY